MLRLSNEQLKLLAQFTCNLGLVFTAGVVSPLFSGSQDVNILIVLLGLILTSICIVTGILLMELIEK